MKNRVIKLTLDEQSIQNAIDQVIQYKKWLTDCTEKFLKELGNEGVKIATANFQEAVYDGTNDVKVNLDIRSETSVAVVAIGKSVLFIEFGTGVKYSQPQHPEAIKNGFVRGEYGYHLGRRESGWRYRGNPGRNGKLITEGKHIGEVHTYGNPANMSMYDTVRKLEEKFEEIARRCYV